MDEKIRSQFVEDVKLALDDEYLQNSYIRYLDSRPNDEEKYKFLAGVYQHYFDDFVRNVANNNTSK